MQVRIFRAPPLPRLKNIVGQPKSEKDDPVTNQSEVILVIPIEDHANPDQDCQILKKRIKDNIQASFALLNDSAGIDK